MTEQEGEAREKGLRSADAFVVRRCQILLASARGERAPGIAEHLGCDDQTVLDALHAFNAAGLACRRKGSSCAKRTRLVFGPAQAERVCVRLRRSPRDFNKPSSVWTADWAAEVRVAAGIVAHRVSGETIGQTVRRLGIRWERAKPWITSPDPAYARKKGGVTA